MDFKKLLVSLIFFSIFITGCSNKNKNIETIDKAKQQQTMTKVQNDVNEIMNKDYNYVLDNMGEPYSITYWVDKDSVNKIGNLEELNKGHIAMTYPKYTSDNKLDGSALYIELNKDKVIEVQTFDFKSCNPTEDDRENNILAIDKYSENIELELDLIENINLSSLKNKNVSYLYEKINNINPRLNIYDMVGKTKSIEIYTLKNSNKILVLFLDNEILKETKIIDESFMINEVKSYLIK